MYRIEEKEHWGKILVAEQDLLPGTELFRDVVLAESVSMKARSRRSKDVPTDGSSEVHDELIKTFNRICREFTVDQKLSLLQLETLCPSAFKENYRLLGFANPADETSSTTRETPSFTTRYMQVVTILRHRCFVRFESDSCPVFATASLLRHSCAPNCCLEFHSNDCVCRVLSPVSKGDELTVTLDENMLLDTTRARRFRLLGSYDFTCHCLRCNAEGDDTRQFKCFDAACVGFHLVCQPRGEPVPGVIPYDVEYVEPHLLPCTVCKRSPPVDFQERMFEYERRTQDKWLSFIARQSDFSGPDMGANTDKMIAMGALMTHMRFPLQRHLFGLQLGEIELTLMPLATPGGMLRGIDKNVRIPQLAGEVDASFDAIMRFPGYTKYAYVNTAVEAYASIGMHEQAVALGRRILRAHRIREGRGEPNYKEQSDRAAKALNRSMARVPATSTAVPEGCCVYCGESPEHAAMKRSRCGACKQAIYCGAACQKAHWALHKRECCI